MSQNDFYLAQIIAFGRKLGWAANIISIITVIFGFVSAIIAVFKIIKRKLYIKKLLRIPAPKGAGAIIICIGKQISPEQAKAFLTEKYPDVPILLKYHKPEFLRPEQLLIAFEEIKEELFIIRQKGELKEIWLFYGGPVTLASVLGAFLDNWLPVKVFAFEKGSFVYYIPIEKETLKAPSKNIST